MSKVLDTSWEAGVLTGRAISAVKAVRDGITDGMGASFDCFLDYEKSSECNCGACDTSQSPVCVICRWLNGVEEE